MKTPSRFVQVHWHAGEYYLKINKDLCNEASGSVCWGRVSASLRAVKLPSLLPQANRTRVFSDGFSSTMSQSD